MGFFPLANSGLIAGFVTTGTIFVVKGEKFTFGRRLVVFSTSKIDVSLPVGGCVVCFLIVVVVVVAATAVVLVVGIVFIVSGSVGMSI